jgi:hypothetical protein
MNSTDSTTETQFVPTAELVGGEAMDVAMEAETVADNRDANELQFFDHDDGVKRGSWVFRCFGWCGRAATSLFGFCSVVVLVAMAACIPVVQVLSLGYLLEVSGRLARGGKFRDAMAGMGKASVLGGILLGCWLSMIPLRVVSSFWYDAHLIAPLSNQTQFLRGVQLVLMVITFAHLFSAVACGGKLRYFLWPLIAPFSLGVWAVRRMSGLPIFKKIMQVTLGWCAPRVVADISAVKPFADWFVPAILWKRIRAGNMYARSRDAVWNFAASLRLPYYFGLGFKGFLGTAMWLLVPSSLFILAGQTTGPPSVLLTLGGFLIGVPVFASLLFLQTHFATDGKLSRFVQIRKVFRVFGRAPLAHVFSLLIVFVLSVPLFLAKIELIPFELMWVLSLLFVVLSFPGRLLVGWAYRRGQRNQARSRWWLKYPFVLLTGPLSVAFVGLYFIFRYVSWHGSYSFVENHVFLFPAPFWL